MLQGGLKAWREAQAVLPALIFDVLVLFYLLVKCTGRPKGESFSFRTTIVCGTERRRFF